MFPAFEAKHWRSPNSHLPPPHCPTLPLDILRYDLLAQCMQIRNSHGLRDHVLKVELCLMFQGMCSREAASAFVVLIFPSVIILGRVYIFSSLDESLTNRTRPHYRSVTAGDNSSSHMNRKSSLCIPLASLISLQFNHFIVYEVLSFNNPASRPIINLVHRSHSLT